MLQTPRDRYLLWLEGEGSRERLHRGVISVAPLTARLLAARRDHLDLTVEQIVGRGRAPRVCLYARSVGGQEPKQSLATMRQYAEEQGWRVGDSYTDPYGEIPPEARPGWSGVRSAVHCGFADGVVVVTHDVISADLAVYEQQLAWFRERPAFVAVLVPETGETPAGRPR